MSASTGLRAERVGRAAGGRLILDGVDITPPPGANVGIRSAPTARANRPC
ncbi:hypothetical protein SMICM304S_07577 [Streptomyces microflavus]